MPDPDPQSPDTPWSLTASRVVERLEVDAATGLDPGEVERRRESFGENRLQEAARRGLWAILWEQLRSLIMLLLVAAVGVSLLFGEVVEALAIGVVIVLNTAIGFITEWRAVRSMEALQEMGQSESLVRRGGEQSSIPAAQLVPGDIVLLQQGGVITADLRILEVDNLQVDESALTGESVPVPKQVEPVEEEAGPGDRSCMAFRGTAVTRGWGVGVVVGTGMDTEIGSISRMVATAESSSTPLEKRLDRLGSRLVWLTLAVAVLVTGSGLVAGRDTFLMIQTGIALAVAAVPEGLIIVATIALARGVHRMARHNALIRRLSSVETLGSTTVICSDKTGTLTENRMQVRVLEGPDGRYEVEGGVDAPRVQLDGQEISMEDDAPLRRLVQVAVLANEIDAVEAGDEGTEQGGDPMEVALLRLGHGLGMHRPELVDRLPQIREEPFERESTMMSSFHRLEDGSTMVAVKGAPEAVLEAATRIRGEGEGASLEEPERDRWRRRVDELAGEGLRVLALACKSANPEDDPYTELEFLGLVGLMDPPREGVAEAVRACRDAGIRVVMVTGDHAETARRIAADVGIGEASELEVVTGAELKEMDDPHHDRIVRASVFARVDPEQKLNLVDGFQQRGHVIAMTGDGVNDAPALKKADIGVAMGRRGTDVAREAAAMVLLDDAFGSIVEAVRQGRIIFHNIRTFVIYLLSGNVGEILAVGLAAVAGAPLPLLPLQILYINLVNDVFPALALGMGPGPGKVMESPPRESKEAILERGHWLAIGLYGAVIAGAILAAFFFVLEGMGRPVEEAVTTAFLAVSLSRLFHVFNMRSPASGALSNEVTRNRFVWGAIGICLVLLAVAVYVPGLAGVLGVIPPGAGQWGVILVAALLPVVLVQPALAWMGRRRD